MLFRQTGPLALGSTTVTTGLEDEAGSVVLLTIDVYNAPREDLLPLQSIIAIKEPYFTLAIGQDHREGEKGRGHILVQHLSDLMLLRRTDACAPLQFRTLVDDANKHALKCKEEGNLALKNGEHVRALEWYTEGISVCDETGLTKDLAAASLQIPPSRPSRS